MTKRKLKKVKAYTLKNVNVAHRYGFTTKEYNNSNRGKKSHDNLSNLQKEQQKENLTKGRAKRILKIKAEKKIKVNSDYVELYKLVSQSHYSSKGRTPKGKKYNTLFEYTTKGFFENEPDIDTIETMVKNSLIGAFNSGKKGKGGYLTNKAFNSIVNANLLGVKIVKVKVKIEHITNLNMLNAVLEINNNGNKWKGQN